jgi:hypothetical protein
MLTNPPRLQAYVGAERLTLPMPGMHPRELSALKSGLPAMLNGFRHAVGRKDVALKELAQGALDELDAWSIGLAGRLLRTPVTKTLDIETFEATLTKLLYPALRANRNDPPVIELESDVDEETGEDPAWLFPIEFLRIAAPPGKPMRPDDVLRRVLGFHAIVVRRGRVPTGPGLTPQGTVPVSALIYDTSGQVGDLKGPEAQARFFDSNKSHFHMSRWPHGAAFQVDRLRDNDFQMFAERDVAFALAKQVFTISGIYPDRIEPFEGAILHVACHYYTNTPERMTQPAPFLSFNRRGINVGIEALWNAFMAHMNVHVNGTNISRSATERFGQMMVFLNACETATSADHGVSLLEKLFRIGFRHIIASETLLPDPLSTAFATQLYLGLMRGLPLGGALLQARTDLLERYDNPGGLLYTIYGDPWLRFSNRRGN